MNLAIVSKLWENTTPLSGGGTGASIGALVNGLVDNGHRVTLFATGNSETKAQELVSVRKEPYQGDYSEIHEYRNIAEAFRRHREFDLIHCAVEHKSVLFGDLVDTPSLHSIRYGEFFEHEQELLRSYKDLNFVGNSRAITELLPFLNWQESVYNGVNTDEFPLEEDKDDYLLFLARMSEQKGVDLAIDTARKLNKKLILAGKMEDRDKHFLQDKVLPYIDNENIVYKGEVSGEAKLELLKKASCLLQPVRLFEACSNTILEAMACGTPVVALDGGSNRELVEHGTTGFVVSEPGEIEGAVADIKSIEPAACRKRVEENFSRDKMVAGYEEIYKKLIEGYN